jgi:molecular chaperone DnaK (HSP70)
MILVTIYEGENKLVKDNHILGTFKLSGIPAAAKGSPAIEIMIHVDADGVLELKAVDKDNAKEIDTPVLRWTLSKGEV